MNGQWIWCGYQQIVLGSITVGVSPQYKLKYIKFHVFLVRKNVSCVIPEARTIKMILDMISNKVHGDLTPTSKRPHIDLKMSPMIQVYNLETVLTCFKSGVFRCKSLTSQDDVNETCLELLAALDEVDKPYFQPIVQQAAEKIKAEEVHWCFYLMLQFLLIIPCILRFGFFLCVLHVCMSFSCRCPKSRRREEQQNRSLHPLSTRMKYHRPGPSHLVIQQKMWREQHLQHRKLEQNEPSLVVIVWPQVISKLCYPRVAAFPECLENMTHPRSFSPLSTRVNQHQFIAKQMNYMIFWCSVRFFSHQNDRPNYFTVKCSLDDPSFRSWRAHWILHPQVSDHVKPWWYQCIARCACLDICSLQSPLSWGFSCDVIWLFDFMILYVFWVMYHRIMYAFYRQPMT